MDADREPAAMSWWTTPAAQADRAMFYALAKDHKFAIDTSITDIAYEKKVPRSQRRDDGTED